MTKTRTTLLASTIAALLAIGGTAGAEQPADAHYRAGVAAYQNCQHADALTSLTLAAHAGHRHAQEVAGLMNLLGASFYGSGVATDERAAMRWFERAAMQGSEIGMRMTGAKPAARVAEERAIDLDVVAEWR